MGTIDVKVNINILPFGQAILKFKYYNLIFNKKKIQEPVYAEPETTNVNFITIPLMNSDYIIPQTTG